MCTIKTLRYNTINNNILETKMTLEQQDKKYVLQTYARDYTNFVKGVGSTLYDENGKDYIDFASGIGVNSVGHGNEKLASAICEQAKKIIHISNLQVIEPQAKLAQKIVELSGYDMGIFFANSGAEANEGAIKIARKYGQINFDEKRYKVITLEHSFHGRTITTVKATGQESFHTPHFSPYPAGFSYEKSIADVYKAIDDETIAYASFFSGKTKANIETTRKVAVGIFQPPMEGYQIKGKFVKWETSGAIFDKVATPAVEMLKEAGLSVTPNAVGIIKVTEAYALSIPLAGEKLA